MDTNRLNKLHNDSRALLDTLADRLPPERVKKLRTLSDVGEWMEMVNGMCASLVKRQIPITPTERDALANLLGMFTTERPGYEYLTGKEETLAALNVRE